MRTMSLLVAALLSTAMPCAAAAPAGAQEAGGTDSVAVSRASAALEGAAVGRLDTPSLRVYLEKPRPTPDGLSYEKLLPPIPLDAGQLPRIVPWRDVQGLEVRGPGRVHWALGLGLVGAYLGHVAWTGSSKILVIGGDRVRAPSDRQAMFVMEGFIAGWGLGMLMNAVGMRWHETYSKPER